MAQLIWTMLYSFFLLLSPMNEEGMVDRILTEYLTIKTLSSLIYGFLVYGYLLWIHVALPEFFGIVAFMLNYIPEATCRVVLEHAVIHEEYCALKLSSNCEVSQEYGCQGG